MDCKVVQELLELKEQELLGPSTEALIDQHLQECGGCQQRWEQCLKEQQVFQDIPSEPLEPADDTAVVKKILTLREGRSRLLKYGLLGICWGLISPAAIHDGFIITKIIAQIPRFIAFRLLLLLPGPVLQGRKYHLLPNLDFAAWYMLAVLVGCVLLLSYAYFTSPVKPMDKKRFAGIIGILILLGGMWLGGTYAVYQDQQEGITGFTSLETVTVLEGSRVHGQGRELRLQEKEQLVQLLQSSPMTVTPNPSSNWRETSHWFHLGYDNNQRYSAHYQPDRGVFVFDYYYVYSVGEDFEAFLSSLEGGEGQ